MRAHREKTLAFVVALGMDAGSSRALKDKTMARKSTTHAASLSHSEKHGQHLEGDLTVKA